MQQPPSPPIDALERRWRTAALVAWAVAAVELVAVATLSALLVGRPVLGRAAASPAAARPERTHPRAGAGIAPARFPRPLAPQLSRRRTAVLVLNGNGVAGAAAAAAARVRARGYVVAAVGNAPRSDYARSLVMYRPGYEAEARRLARDLGLGLVAPLDGLRPPELRGAHAALIVGH